MFAQDLSQLSKVCVVLPQDADINTPSKDVLELLATSCNGDIRSCINALQFYCTDRKWIVHILIDYFLEYVIRNQKRSRKYIYINKLIKGLFSPFQLQILCQLQLTLEFHQCTNQLQFFT